MYFIEDIIHSSFPVCSDNTFSMWRPIVKLAQITQRITLYNDKLEELGGEIYRNPRQFQMKTVAFLCYVMSPSNDSTWTFSASLTSSGNIHLIHRKTNNMRVSNAA
jgi:hypothetical protein